MEKFLNLPKEKQSKIIDGALSCFGTNGYKKTSVSDIALAAGISKAMVFHYFGSKKELYYFLIEYCADILVQEVSEKYDTGITDFFDRIKMGTEVKISVLKKHQWLLSFIYSVYQEREEEVRDGIQLMLKKGEDFRDKIAFLDMDNSKFKKGVDPQLVMKMLTLIGEGYANSIDKGMTLEDMSTEFNQFLQLLKSNLYKEDYL